VPGDARNLPDVPPESPAQIQYTSATTGFPKGALLSHRSLTNNSRFGLELLGTRRGDNYLNVLPMFHTAGCAFGMLGSVQWRRRVIMAKLFEPMNINAVIERERVNLMVAVPTMLISMLEALELQPRDL
jgi:fatty-acyl-CoA synthase